MPSTPLLWRSSPPGVDLLAFFCANPESSAGARGVRGWLGARAGGYVEQVASLSWIGALVHARRMAIRRVSAGPLLALADRRVCPACRWARSFRSPASTPRFPGPWALLRYAPLVGAARMPGRMSIVVDDGVLRAVRARARRADAAAIRSDATPAPVGGRVLLIGGTPAGAAHAVSGRRAARLRDDRRRSPAGPRPRAAHRRARRPVVDRQLQRGHAVLSGLPRQGPVGGYLSRVSARRKQFYRRAPGDERADRRERGPNARSRSRSIAPSPARTHFLARPTSATSS